MFNSMLKIHPKFSFLIVIFIITGCSQNQTSEADWTADFVVWNEDVYVVTDEFIEEKEIGEQIGKITKYSDQEMTAKEGQVFSNIFPKGSVLYSIKGIDTTNSIAVKNEGKYIKLVYNGRYG
ncbi:hypothetical protein LC087_04380 [Bacillus carboniphilus]|uniref:Lipoprotein n=1 Tax=Bacillus carboniphilus TaxID=86663 RepID=A0ABY9JXA7_9BACI|nr:hypothetical protein [Bacillus carboniphilus]WLR43418.1 hypothetical protein LC087_04380 [Bacillus carboniphilus]